MYLPAYCYALAARVIPQTPDNPRRGLPSYPYPLETARSIKRERQIPEARDAPGLCGFLLC